MKTNTRGSKFFNVSGGQRKSRKPPKPGSEKIGPCYRVTEEVKEGKKVDLNTAETIISSREANYRDRIALYLRGLKWYTMAEVETDYGRIDLLAKKEGYTLLLEVKLSAGTNDVAKALGQLMFYSQAHPKAKRWVVVPSAPNKFAVDTLKKFQVEILIVPMRGDLTNSQFPVDAAKDGCYYVPANQNARGF